MRVAPERKRRRLPAPFGSGLREELLLGPVALEPSSGSEDEAPVHFGATGKATALEADVVGTPVVAPGLRVPSEDESEAEAAVSDGRAAFKLAEVPALARTYVARVVSKLRQLPRTVL